MFFDILSFLSSGIGISVSYPKNQRIKYGDGRDIAWELSIGQNGLKPVALPAM
jgi:hypothetical protein